MNHRLWHCVISSVYKGKEQPVIKVFCGWIFSFRKMLTTLNSYSAILLAYIWSKEITSALFSCIHELNLVWQISNVRAFNFNTTYQQNVTFILIYKVRYLKKKMWWFPPLSWLDVWVFVTQSGRKIVFETFNISVS